MADQSTAERDPDAFAAQFLRATLLASRGAPDAANAVGEKAIPLIADISDDAARELYGLLNGFAAALAMAGQRGADQFLAFVQLTAPTSDEMRGAITAVLTALAQGKFNV